MIRTSFPVDVPSGKAFCELKVKPYEIMTIRPG